MTRKDKLLKRVQTKGQGLEIGPLCWPLLLKSEYNVKYVDHVSAAKLKKIYKDDAGVALDRIDDVDYPLDGRSLRDAVGGKKLFDYVVASHVIEHVPDMVDWLQDMASVLKPGGTLSLAVPDKRYTFDIDRYPSTVGDIVGPYIEKLSKPSAATVFNYISHFRLKIEAAEAWKGDLFLNSTAPHRWSLQEAYDSAVKNQSPSTYIDTHCNVFTPVSFFEILRGLIELRLFDYTVEAFFDTEEGAYEFIVVLTKLDQPDPAKQFKSLPKLPKVLYDRELQVTLEQLQLRADRLQADLDGILNSKSWRMTGPARKLIGLKRGKTPK